MHTWIVGVFIKRRIFFRGLFQMHTRTRARARMHARMHVRTSYILGGVLLFHLIDIQGHEAPHHFT